MTLFLTKEPQYYILLVASEFRVNVGESMIFQKKSILVILLIFGLGVNQSLFAAVSNPNPQMLERQNFDIQTNESRSLTAPSALAYSEIFRIQDIAAIVPYIDKNTLVAFDIDYTLFRSKTNLGTPEWITHLIKKVKDEGNTREESFKKVYPIWMRAQKFSDITLLDGRLIQALSDIKKKAVACMAVTNRQPESAEVTVWQLNKFGIDFSDSPVAALPFNSPFKYPALFHAGILFTHDFNKKGAVFREWYLQAIPEITKRKSVKRIVYIDDNISHLFSMQKAAIDLGLEFIGFHYTAGNAYKKKFNPSLVETEQKILMSNVSDSEIRLELENAGTYANLNE